MCFISLATDIFEKAMVLYIGQPKSLKQQWFIDWATEIVKKAVALYIGQPKSLKKHWFYKSGNRNRLKKNMCSINRATKIV